MAIRPNTVLYFDTNALRALKFAKEISVLLDASKSGEANITLSEWVIYEYARQAFNRQIDAPISQVALIAKLSGKRRQDILRSYHVFFKTTFKAHGVNVIDHTENIAVAADRIISDDGTYFSVDNDNDRRDALILASALHALRNENSIIICQEKKLKTEFERRGFHVQDDAKKFMTDTFPNRKVEKVLTPDISEILRDTDRINFSEDFHTALQRVDDTYAQLFVSDEPLAAEALVDLKVAQQRVGELGKDDSQTRLDILAYVYWFAPLGKKDLVQMLEERQIREELIQNSADRLAMAGLIRDTGAYYLPDREGVCEAIGINRVDEFIGLLKAN